MAQLVRLQSAFTGRAGSLRGCFLARSIMLGSVFSSSFISLADEHTNEHAATTAITTAAAAATATSAHNCCADDLPKHKQSWQETRLEAAAAREREIEDRGAAKAKEAAKARGLPLPEDFNDGPPTVADRLLSALPYTLPLMDNLVFGAHIFQTFPTQVCAFVSGCVFLQYHWIVFGCLLCFFSVVCLLVELRRVRRVRRLRCFLRCVCHVEGALCDPPVFQRPFFRCCCVHDIHTRTQRVKGIDRLSLIGGVRRRIQTVCSIRFDPTE